MQVLLWLTVSRNKCCPISVLLNSSTIVYSPKSCSRVVSGGGILELYSEVLSRLKSDTPLTKSEKLFLSLAWLVSYENSNAGLATV